MSFTLYGAPGLRISSDATRFERNGPHARKIHCIICGREGYGLVGTQRTAPWQEGCLRGHTACRDCGKMLADLRNGSPRSHHPCRGVTVIQKYTV